MRAVMFAEHARLCLDRGRDCRACDGTPNHHRAHGMMPPEFDPRTRQRWNLSIVTVSRSRPVLWINFVYRREPIPARGVGASHISAGRLPPYPPNSRLAKRPRVQARGLFFTGGLLPAPPTRLPLAAAVLPEILFDLTAFQFGAVSCPPPAGLFLVSLSYS
jgi:hypothetical protein